MGARHDFSSPHRLGGMLTGEVATSMQTFRSEVHSPLNLAPVTTEYLPA
jgi:hypothetical protein